MAYIFNDDRSKADIVTVECMFEPGSESKQKIFTFDEIGLDKYRNYDLDNIIILSCQTQGDSSTATEMWNLIGDGKVSIEKPLNFDENIIRFRVSNIPSTSPWRKTVKATLLFLN